MGETTSAGMLISRSVNMSPTWADDSGDSKPARCEKWDDPEHFAYK